MNQHNNFNEQLIVHTRRAPAMDIVRLVHAFAKKDGRDRIVVLWIKMRYNVYPTAVDTVHSIWILKRAIVKPNGAATIVQKVNNKLHIYPKWRGIVFVSTATATVAIRWIWTSANSLTF